MSNLFDDSDDSDDTESETEELIDDILLELLTQKHSQKIDKRKGFKRPNCDENGNKRQRNNYYNFTWYKFLQNERERLEQPTSREATLFRLRFRLPYRIYQYLLDWTKTWYQVKKTDVAGRQSIPVELLLLGVFRILGRGTCFDGINELTGISNQSMKDFRIF